MTTGTAPTIHSARAINVTNVPDELRSLDRWVLWRHVTKPGAAKPTKIPYQVRAPHIEAESDNPETWATFDEAIAVMDSMPGRFAGVGVMLGTLADGRTLAGVDLDECIDPDTGGMDPEAQRIIEFLDTYTERSPGWCGAKLFGFGRIGSDRGRKFDGTWASGTGRVELYDHGRFFTVTGDSWPGTPAVVDDIDPRLKALFNRLESNRQAKRPNHRPAPAPSKHRGDVPADQRAERCRKYIEKMPDAISGQRGHDRTLQAACETVRFGLDESATWSVMRWFNDSKTGGERWNDTELAHKIRSAQELAGSERGIRLRDDRPRRKTNGHAPRPAPAPAASDASTNDSKMGGEPEAEGYVLVPGEHLTDEGEVIERGAHDFTNEGIDRLPVGSVYRRGNVPGQIVGESGAREFAELKTDAARIVIDGAMKLGTWEAKGTGKSEHHALAFCPCSRDHSNLLLARAAIDSRIPSLRHLTSYPIYLPGFELARPGYHDGVFYDEPEELRGMDIERDAEVIRQAIDDLIIDFPFKDEPSRQNYIGLLLTPLIRPAIESNVPGTLGHAPLERTGKTKLMEEVFGGIITGRRTPAMQIAESNEEMDKRITAILLRGGTVMHLDNLKEFVDLPCLASLLTATTYQGRLLGSSKIVELPNNLTIVATGNNVRSSGEIAKRMVPVCLQPETDAPELRTDFKHPNLWAYVRQNRRLVLGCLLGMVRTWVEAGKPRGRKPMGGFDEWAAVVGGIMDVFDYSEWLGNAKEWRDQADTHRSDLRALVDEWQKLQATDQKPLTVAEVVNIALRFELFSEVTAGKEGKALLTAFGMRVLARNLDTPVGNWIIRKNSVSRPALYSLKPLAEGVAA